MGFPGETHLQLNLALLITLVSDGLRLLTGVFCRCATPSPSHLRLISICCLSCPAHACRSSCGHSVCNLSPGKSSRQLVNKFVTSREAALHDSLSPGKVLDHLMPRLNLQPLGVRRWPVDRAGRVLYFPRGKFSDVERSAGDWVHAMHRRADRGGWGGSLSPVKDVGISSINLWRR